MQVHQHLDQLPLFNKSVVTIGTFDGVHKGHQKIIQAIRTEANGIGGESILITFHPHPRKIVNGNFSLQLINTLEEKIDLLFGHGIDHLVVVPFTPQFAEQPAEAYIQDFLVKKFQPHTVIIGYDHHFGKDRSGNFSLLERFSNQYNYRLIEIPKHVVNEIDISSTKIRDAILAGQVHIANDLLGYPFFFSGLVVHGDKIGRQLGYPTANLEYNNSDKIRLGHGVYAVDVMVQGHLHKGMMSIGNRPTINGISERVEVNIFDFDAEIYGAELKVIAKKFLRTQTRFNNLEELKAQLQIDKEESLKV